MYYELYIDVLFLENLMLDYLLLSLLRKLLKCPGGRLRRLLAAALGSAGTCLLYAFSLERTLPGYLLLYVVLSVAMVKAGLRIQGKRMLAKAVFLLYAQSVALGGLFSWAAEHVRFPVYPFLGITLLSFTLLSVGAEYLFRLRSTEQNLCQVVLQFQGRSISVKALKDTGNRLREPVFGKPVSILTQKRKEELCQGAEVLCYPVPFHSIGKANGILQAFYADCMYIQTQEGQIRIWERPLLGITKEPLSSKEEYDMILHPELLE